MKHFITILIISSLMNPPRFIKLTDTILPKYNYYSLSADLKVAPNFYTTKTGFFCNTERSLQKQTKIPIKFRLGSVEQTQKLEGYNLSTLPSFP